MANNFTKFRTGINVGTDSGSVVTVLGDLAANTSTNKLEFHNGTSASPVVTEAHTATLTNKTITGNTAVNLVSGSGTITFNTTGTITVPNATDTLVGKATTDILTNKTLSGNTASNLVNGAGTINFNSTGTITVPNATDTLVGRNTTDTLTNKTLDNSTTLTIKDTNFTIQDDGDTSKQAKFQASGITTATTRTFTLPDANTTLVGTDATQTLTNKTLTGNTAANLISGSGTFTLNTTGTITAPNTTDTLVGKATTDSLTNKTFADAITGAQIATPSNPSSGFDRLYFKSDDKLYSLTSAGVETQVSSASFNDSSVSLSSGNGHGSSNTTVRRYSNNTVVGTDISYADSSTLGMTITINTTGTYAISVEDSDNVTNTIIGFTKNGSNLSSNINASANATAKLASNTSPSASIPASASWTGPLTASDVIRAQDNGTASMENGNGFAQFTIVRVK